MTCALPRTADDITPDWLTEALRAGGLHGITVDAATTTRIGRAEGFTGGGVYRIALRVRGADGTAPATIVAKLSPADPKRAAAFYPVNRREVAFYTRIAAQGGLAVPQCWFGAVDPARHASILLLQDLGGARSVPFAEGLAPRDAEALVEALAAIHAAWWQRPELGACGPEILDGFDLAACWARYPACVGDLLGDVVLPASFLRLGDYLVTHRAAIFGALFDEGPVTCLHRDCQADNVVFGADGRATLFDWQFMGRGRGTLDVTYALVSSLTPDARRACEARLVARYHAALGQGGVGDYGLDLCRRDYLRGVAVKVLMTVIATVRFDNASPYRIAWRRADLKRLLAFCADHQIGPPTFS